MDAPQNPVGEYVPDDGYDNNRHDELIGIVADAPANLRSAVSGLSEDALETRYRNWTIRQIVHHLADSHAHSLIRFKWTLTEETPTIKAYDEGKWAELPDSRSGNVDASLLMLDGIHQRWVRLMRSMNDQQFARAFFHPESKKVVTLHAALSYYAWHGRHHTGQIQWLRQRHGW